MENPQFVVCLNNDGVQASLEVGKLYQMLPDKDARTEDYLRIIDEDGEDYLYPTDMFHPISVPSTVAETLLSKWKQG